jgi:hypothetical protein
LALEAANNPIGGIIGLAYSRLNGAMVFSRSLPFPATEGVVQSNVTWTALDTTSTVVRWSRFYCGNFLLGPDCSAYGTSASTSAAPSDVHAAVTRGGGCMLVAWSEGAARRGFAEPRPACESQTSGCVGPFVASSAALNAGTGVGTWDANGEDTLLVARPQGGGGPVLVDKLAPGVCAFSGAPAATFSSLPGLLVNAQPAQLRPVRVGGLIGVLYLDSNSRLRLVVQP